MTKTTVALLLGLMTIVAIEAVVIFRQHNTIERLRHSQGQIIQECRRRIDSVDDCDQQLTFQLNAIEECCGGLSDALEDIAKVKFLRRQCGQQRSKSEVHHDR